MSDTLKESLDKIQTANIRAKSELQRLGKKTENPEPEENEEKMPTDGPVHVPWGITSLSDLNAWHESQRAHNELRAVVMALNEVTDNIFMDPEITDKPGAVLRLANEFADFVQDMISEAATEMRELPERKIHRKVEEDLEQGLFQKWTKAKPEIITESEDGGLVLYKARDGKTYLYGRPTNRWRDRDSFSHPKKGGEIITDEAHKGFISYLDENPHAAPELWFLHEDVTAFKNIASWWDYSDGFVHLVWPIEPEEVKRIENFVKEYTPGMSHGFQPLERDEDDGLITAYRMHEASILPVDMAANVFAGFEIVDIKELGKMFTDDKRAILIDVFGEEWVSQREKSNETLETQLDQHIESKEIEEMPDERIEEEVEETKTEEAEGSQVDTDTVDLSVLNAKLEEVMNLVGNSVSEINNRLTQLEEDKKKQDVKAGMTMATFAAKLSSNRGHSVAGAKQAHVPANNNGFSEPEESKSVNHILAGL